MNQSDYLSQEAVGGSSPLPVTPSATHPRIEAYLEQIDTPLIGQVPATRLAELRTELRMHLEARVAAYRELGSGPEEAVRAAVEQFGDPRRLACEWVREWRQPARSHAGETLLATGVLSVSALFGASLLVALEGHLGHNAFELALAGPLLPLAAGFLVGLRRGKHPLGSRWGLLLIATASLGISLLMSAADPRPPLVSTLRVLLWTMTACGTAGLGALISGWRDRTPLRPAGL
jgi:hypothetical protein